MAGRADGGAFAVVGIVLILAIAGGGFAFVQMLRAQKSEAVARAQANVHALEAHTQERVARAAEAKIEASASMRADLDAALARNAELEGEVRELQLELAAAQSERLDREMEWMEFTQAVASLSADSPKLEFAKELLSDEPGAIEEEEPAEPDPAEVERARRSGEIANQVRALMHADWVHGIGLVDAGMLDDEGWIGPVVFRLVDGEGRLAGGLVAERMRFEASRAGHVVTLVLEEGSETGDGVARPFADGVRRISFPGVDPAPWIEALPELFTDAASEARDDGLWNLRVVRDELNRLLAEDATGEVLHFKHVGGVEDDVLFDLHVAVLDVAGKTTRHLFADRCEIAAGSSGVTLTFEDGVTMRGDSRSPFLDGRHRVFLPRATRGVWSDAGIPGVAPSRAAIGSDAEGGVAAGDESGESAEDSDATSSENRR